MWLHRRRHSLYRQRVRNGHQQLRAAGVVRQLPTGHPQMLWQLVCLQYLSMSVARQSRWGSHAVVYIRGRAPWRNAD